METNDKKAGKLLLTVAVEVYVSPNGVKADDLINKLVDTVKKTVRDGLLDGTGANVDRVKLWVDAPDIIRHEFFYDTKDDPDNAPPVSTGPGR